METMKEYGRVVAIEGADAMIKFIRTSACGRCHACGMISGQNEIVVNVPNTMGAEVGDRVAINIRMKKALGASAIAYVFPLVMLVLGAIVGWLLSGVWHVFKSVDVTMAICAIIFAALAFPLMKLASPLYSRQVTNVYTMEEVKKPGEETHNRKYPQ